MTQWGIRARVLLVGVLPALLLSALLGTYFISFHVLKLESMLQERGQAIASQVAAASDYGVFSGNREALQAAANAGLKGPPDVRGVLILGASGVVLAASGELAAHPVGQRALLEENGALRFRAPIRSAPVSLEDYLDDGIKPATAGAEDQGTVVVELSRDLLAQAQAEYLIDSVLLTLAVVGVAVILAYRMSDTVSRPIREVADAVQAIGGGRLHTRVAVGAGGSLNRLASGVNEMAQRLETSRAGLIDRIEEATAELKRRKEEAEQASVAKSRFLAAASHDLRQPMHALGLFVAALAERRLQGTEAHLLGRIQASVEAMETLLDGLLDISKLEAGVVVAEIRDVHANRVLNHIRTEFSDLAAARGLRFRVMPCSLTLFSYPTLLTRILTNLVSNALRYTEAGGVVVGCRRRGPTVRIQVWDSGVGIPDCSLQEIFHEFVQLHNPQRDRTKGMGLGLAIVTRLSSLLGHPVGVRSHPGLGSVFWVDVPLGNPARASQLEVEPVAVWNPFEDRLVVVLDDDQMVRDSMEGLMEGWGCRVIATASADEAATIIREFGQEPDLFLCDLRLTAARDGLDMLDRMRAEFGTRIPGVLITGDTGEEVVRVAESRGYPTLHKPVRPARLRALVQHLLTRDDDEEGE